MPSGGPESTVPFEAPYVEFYCYVNIFLLGTEQRQLSGDMKPRGPGRVRGFHLTVPGAPTLRGVEIGDDLQDASKLYPELRCGEIPPREPIFPGTPGDPYCEGETGDDRYLWLGGDPVNHISVGVQDFDG